MGEYKEKGCIVQSDCQISMEKIALLDSLTHGGVRGRRLITG